MPRAGSLRTLRRGLAAGVVVFGGLLAACGPSTSPSEPSARCGPGSVCTVVGTSIAGYGPEAVAATEMPLYLPQDVAVGPDGRLIVADWNNHRMLIVEDGVARTLVGSGFPGDGPEGPAVGADLNHPTSVAFGADRWWIAGFHNARVVSVDYATEALRFEAGTGMRGFEGDGGDALAAELNQPGSVAWASDGSVYVADQGNLVVRRIAPDGTIARFAGTLGVSGYAGDGGPASEAVFGTPTVGYGMPSVRLLLDEPLLYVVDATNHAIRVIDLETGIVDTLVGDGIAGYAGDGGPLEGARLDTPSDVAIDPDGALYVADSGNHCIRRIVDGAIDTFAGVCGTSGPAEEGVAREDAWFSSPAGIDVDPQTGAVLVADFANHRVRAVRP